MVNKFRKYLIFAGDLSSYLGMPLESSLELKLNTRLYLDINPYNHKVLCGPSDVIQFFELPRHPVAKLKCRNSCDTMMGMKPKTSFILCGSKKSKIKGIKPP